MIATPTSAGDPDYRVPRKTETNPMLMSMILTRVASWRRYRQTFRELDGLTDRELAELGLGRRDIRTIARQSAVM
jgi:uncharacterized protein YjiS (DUF1127 family)